MGSRTTWRRRVNRVAAPVAAIGGSILIFSSVFFVEQFVSVAVIAAGIFMLEAGVWYMANPIFTSERRYADLREQLDHLIQLVRQLNRTAVGDGTKDQLEQLRSSMHESVDEMSRLAGKEGEQSAPQREAREQGPSQPVQ